MKQITIRLYKFEELSEQAQESVILRERNNIAERHMEWVSSDIRATVSEFEKLTDCRIEFCSYGTPLVYFNRDITVYTGDCEPTSIDSLSGKLLFRYISNEIMPYVVKNKTYYGKNGKKRTSHILADTCNGLVTLTGLWCDYEILKPLFDYYKKGWRKDNRTYHELINDCAASISDTYDMERNYAYSDEFTRQELTESSLYENTLYFADGTEYSGTVEDAA